MEPQNYYERAHIPVDENGVRIELGDTPKPPAGTWPLHPAVLNPAVDRGRLALLFLFVAFFPLVTHRIYASDEIQYFSYTHSLFFDRDLDFSNQYLYFCNVDKVKFADFCRDLYGKREPATGLPINVAPIGTGLFWMPPFALAHAGVLAARALGATVKADGFSAPYIFAITWASYAYGCIGLYYALSNHDRPR